MYTFSDTERRKWESILNDILNDASVSLAKVVMEHSSRNAEELKSTALVKHKEAVLSNVEQSEVERHEDMRKTKTQNKCELDKISIWRDARALKRVAEVEGREGLKTVIPKQKKKKKKQRSRRRKKEKTAFSALTCWTSQINSSL